MSGNNIQLANDFAEYYDHSVVKNNWNAPQIIFNAVNNLLSPNSSILDIGIGTGESSVLFQKARHSVTGVDGSVKMLEKCKKKNIGQEHALVNIEQEPLPFFKQTFNAAISVGVFHLIYPLNQIFSETEKVLKHNGYFAFTFEETEKTGDYTEISPGAWEHKTNTGVYTYQYSDIYITTLLQQNGFTEIDRIKFLAFQNTELHKDFYFTAILAQLTQNQFYL